MRYPSSNLQCKLIDTAGGLLSDPAERDPEYFRRVPAVTRGQLDCLTCLQETLLILRALLGEAMTHLGALDDLTANSAAMRISLALTSRP